MHFNHNFSIRFVANFSLIAIYFVSYVLIEVLSNSVPNSGHKIESSHSNQIKSFDDSIYFKINWLGNNPESDPQIDKHIHYFDQLLDQNSNQPKVQNNKNFENCL